MRIIRWLLISFLIGLIFPDAAFSWGGEGHRTVAKLASWYVSPEALKKVNELLAASGERDLPSISTWADDLRLAARDEGPLRGNMEALAFNQDFPTNADWHFVNLPLNAESYESVKNFGSKDDVVHAITCCITVLESLNPLPNMMTRIQALKFLVHLVGDIHQPLHCGCGFYNLTDPKAPQLISNPKIAFGQPSDRGGNDLFYDLKNNQELHAFWDTIVVMAIADTPDYKGLAAYLERRHQMSEVPLTPGSYKGWAERWAIDSVKCATQAYAGIRFGHLDSFADQRPIRITITLPTGYAENSKRIAVQQLFAASVHLAQLLDSIQWP